MHNALVELFAIIVALTLAGRPLRPSVSALPAPLLLWPTGAAPAALSLSLFPLPRHQYPLDVPREA